MNIDLEVPPPEAANYERSPRDLKQAERPRIPYVEEPPIDPDIVDPFGRFEP